jgi:RNA polymerase sigma-70 factor (ECF subfamily)
MAFSRGDVLRAGEADDTLQMDEEAFRALYDRTARGLWAYLSRMTGDAQLADDLLQETYYRFLRASASYESDEHRLHYLFRIATNLVRDGHRRRHGVQQVALPEGEGPADARAGDVAARADERADVRRALSRLKTRERKLLWLAYAEGSSHKEIAGALGLTPGSVKMLLFRARRKLARLLGVEGATS